jgi:hypothetical protein
MVSCETEFEGPEGAVSIAVAEVEEGTAISVAIDVATTANARARLGHPARTRPWLLLMERFLSFER